MAEKNRLGASQDVHTKAVNNMEDTEMTRQIGTQTSCKRAVTEMWIKWVTVKATWNKASKMKQWYKD